MESPLPPSGDKDVYEVGEGHHLGPNRYRNHLCSLIGEMTCFSIDSPMLDHHQVL